MATTTTPAALPAVDLHHLDSFVWHAIVLFVFLLLEYGLGAAISIFITLPRTASGTVSSSDVWNFAWQQGVFVAHVVVAGIDIILVLTLVLRVLLFRRDVVWIVCTVLCATTIGIALGAGIAYVPNQTTSLSYLMAIAFLVSVLAIVIPIALHRRPLQVIVPPPSLASSPGTVVKV